MQQVGPENIFIFGLTAEQVTEKRRAGVTGQDAAANSPRLTEVLESIGEGEFSPDDTSRFHSLVDTVLVPDHFMVAADFDAYWQAQRQVDWLWREPSAWWRASILNTARMGFFSSDRTIREYASEIWGIGDLS
jgi:starch phosphorylase